MDKYQNLVFFSGTKYCFGTKGFGHTNPAKIEKDTFVVIQNENINIVDYAIIICCQIQKSPLKNVFYSLNDKWYKVDEEKAESLVSWDYRFREMEKNGYVFYCININFENRITSLRFEYKNNIVEPFELNVNYKETNREEYFKKIALQQREELLQKMSLQCKTGDALVNFYWQIARDDVKKVRVELYLDNKQLIMKTDMDTDILFKSIQGLAYGFYYYKISQLNEKGEVIVESDLLGFNLSQSNFRGKPTVVI